MWRSVTQYHQRIGYTYIPGIRARLPHEGGGYLIQTNSDGFRSRHEFVSRKPVGVFRVLLFGDSQTAGDGVSNRDRYSDVLEDLIPELQVYNYGLPGSGTDQQYLCWQEFGREIDHDLLLLAVYVENIGRVASRFRAYADEAGRELIYAKPYYCLDSAGLTLRHVPVPRAPLHRNQMSSTDQMSIDQGVRFPALRALARTLGVRDLLARMTGINPVPDYDDADNPNWRLMSEILTEWIGSSIKPVMVVPLPLFTFVEGMSDPGAYMRRFLELSERTGCLLHDPLPDLTEYDPAERRSFRFGLDVHFTRAGHRAIAESLEAPIVSLIQR